MGHTTISAPSATRASCFSLLTLSGIVSIAQQPRAAESIAIAAPVLPEVFSTIVAPG